mmetsp:Transcript_45373/g.98679  ORF Transcript_45373/g.98679 Transcript_45373/m.98679 type:complete len:402 (+) Transcript_45373:76-1281(+)
MSGLLFLSSAVVFLGVTAEVDLEGIKAQKCFDPLSSKALSEAVDAAIVSLNGEPGWLHNLRQSTGYTHPIQVTTCTPQASQWPWPEAGENQGILSRVLRTGELRVAGVQWSQDGAADYMTDPANPTGFWPEYLKDIAAQMSRRYGKTINIKRVYYPNSVLVVAAVANGTDVDMSEPYYYISGFHDGKPRIEALHYSCVTVATSSAFESTSSSGIMSMTDLFNRIVDGPNRKVGFIGQGNFDAVSHILPANVEPTFVTDSDELIAKVDSGELLARYISEGEAAVTGGRTIYETGVISPRVVLFRQDSTSDCVSAAALATALDAEKDFQKAREEDWQARLKTAEADDDDGGGKIIILIILAVVVLMMTFLMGLLIIKERAGKPLFGKPLLEDSARGQPIGNSF